MYDFDTAVTADITLTAKWDEEAPAEYTVTYDSNGGTSVQSDTVTAGEKAEKPTNPSRIGYYFDGWYNGSAKYDFSSAVNSNITLTAKWITIDDANAAFTAALEADYTNFTSSSKVTEEDVSLTDIFKQTDDMAYWDPDSGLYEEHIVMFGPDGNMLAMYYLHEDEWLKSNLITYADFVVALYLNEIETSDVEYSEGVYYVVPESVASVAYSLYRSTDSYSDLAITVEDGRIAKVVGTVSGMTHEQTFYDYGTTEIDVPDTLPAVTVNITVHNREAEVGTAIDKSELIGFMFEAKVEGKTYAITPDMVTIVNASEEAVDFDDPAEGTYTATVSFTLWNGQTYTETATLTVSTPSADETFADIFAKDYTNMTMIYQQSASNITTILRDGDVYTYPNFYYFIEEDKSLTMYQYKNESYTETKNRWYAMIRVDMLFDLSADIFEQQGDTQVYVAKNVEAIAPIVQKTSLQAAYRVNTLRDYSITLEVSVGRITKVTTSFYFLTGTTVGTASNGTLRTMTYDLGEFGTTEFEIPQPIQDMRSAATTAQTAYIDDKQYAA